TRHTTIHGASSTCGRRDATRGRAIITTLQGRRVYRQCAGSFTRGVGKSKSWLALCSSGPGPERHGYESLSAGRGQVYRRHRFHVRVRRERSIHRKVFSGSVRPSRKPTSRVLREQARVSQWQNPLMMLAVLTLSTTTTLFGT